MNLSIVVPFHNEEGNVEAVLQGYRVFAGTVPFELICVNDGSRDGTKAVFRRLLRSGKYPFVRYINIPPEEHKGYGDAIMRGLEEARGEVVAWTHSDLQTDPADVFRAFEKFVAEKNNQIVVKGKRSGRRFGQFVFSLGMALLSSLVLQRIFYEINAQPKLFHRMFLSHLTDAPDDFSLDLYLLYQAKRNGYRITSIEVKFPDRIHGVSSWASSFKSRYQTVLRTIRYILALRKKLL